MERVSSETSWRESKERPPVKWVIFALCWDKLQERIRQGYIEVLSHDRLDKYLLLQLRLTEDASEAALFPSKQEAESFDERLQTEVGRLPLKSRGFEFVVTNVLPIDQTLGASP